MGSIIIGDDSKYDTLYTLCDGLSPEEWHKYCQQVDDSDGFDVDATVGEEIGQIHPCDFGPDDEDIDDEDNDCVKFVKLAIDLFNEKMPDKYGKLSDGKLTKAMVKASAALRFYITFDAMNMKKGEDKGRKVTYQAVISQGFSKKGEDKDRVLSFRVKPESKDSKKPWMWVRHLCRTMKIKPGEDFENVPGNE